MMELGKKEDKKKKLQRHKQKPNKQILDTEINTTNILKKKKKKYNVSKITCFNCNKKTLCQQLHQAKKLGSILANSIPMINDGKKMAKIP